MKASTGLSNVNLNVKCKCSLQIFDKHSKFRSKVTRIFAFTETINISKIRWSLDENSFRWNCLCISPKGCEKREIRFHSFCTAVFYNS